MSLGPLLPGRIPLSLSGQRLQSNLQTLMYQLTHTQEQISTGQRFFLPSEAPSAALQTITLQKLFERKNQALANVQTDQSLLNASDQAFVTVSDALNQAKSIALAGVGSQSTPEEKATLAAETRALLQDVLNAGNTTFRGRYLFAGSTATTTPFTSLADGSIRYSGDQRPIESLVDLRTALSNSIDGATAFGGFSDAAGRDVNPAVTLSTRIADLNAGRGLTLGQVEITLTDTGLPSTVTRRVDLTGADTLQDVRTRLQNAFAGDPVTLTVGINATNNGLLLTPSSGTIAVADVPGSLTAADLGIRSAAAATVVGGNLDPRLTLQTTLASLNGGAGITATSAGGLRIVNGDRTSIVDVSGATTVEDLFNRLRQADPDLELGFNAAGNGLRVATRRSGVDFSIGENGETTAGDLGLRTFTGSTSLASLNGGLGANVDNGQSLTIHRRDGTTVTSISLAGAKTVQDVLNTINAAAPGVLTATLNSVGNGIQLNDTSGVGALTIDVNELATQLGLGGTAPGPAEPLAGRDVAPAEVKGVFNILVRLAQALESGDDVELGRLSTQIDRETTRVNQARGEVGGRLKILDAINSRLQDETLNIQDSLSKVFDTDPTEAITRMVNQQFILESTLKTAAQTLQLSLLQYL